MQRDSLPTKFEIGDRRSRYINHVGKFFLGEFAAPSFPDALPSQLVQKVFVVGRQHMDNSTLSLRNVKVANMFVLPTLENVG